MRARYYKMLTYNEAINQLEVRTAGLTGESLKEELTRIANEASIAAEGKITCLYSGIGTEIPQSMLTDSNTLPDY